jgi:hypothetical protein
LALLYHTDSWRGRESGQRIYIVGCGHSLYNVDLAPIHTQPVITVNSGILLMPWQDGSCEHRYWLTMDLGVKNWSYFPTVLSAACTRVAAYRLSPYLPANKFVFLKHLRTNSSIIMAFDLALWLGAKEIVLLGVDHYFRDGKSHFWEWWPEAQQPTTTGIRNPHEQQERIFRANQNMFERLSKLARIKGCQVYNCSLDSPIRGFVKKPLADLRPAG